MLRGFPWASATRFCCAQFFDRLVTAVRYWSIRHRGLRISTVFVLRAIHRGMVTTVEPLFPLFEEYAV